MKRELSWKVEPTLLTADGSDDGQDRRVFGQDWRTSLVVVNL
jgi:hypothetical protein